MILPTLGLDINVKHTHLQTLARQDKERQGEETCIKRSHYVAGFLEGNACRWMWVIWSLETGHGCDFC